jgi:hypothetical protein
MALTLCVFQVVMRVLTICSALLSFSVSGVIMGSPVAARELFATKLRSRT